MAILTYQSPDHPEFLPDERTEGHSRGEANHNLSVKSQIIIQQCSHFIANVLLTVRTPAFRKRSYRGYQMIHRFIRAISDTQEDKKSHSI